MFVGASPEQRQRRDDCAEWIQHVVRHTAGKSVQLVDLRIEHGRVFAQQAVVRACGAVREHNRDERHERGQAVEFDDRAQRRVANAPNVGRHGLGLLDVVLECCRYRALRRVEGIVDGAGLRRFDKGGNRLIRATRRSDDQCDRVMHVLPERVPVPLLAGKRCELQISGDVAL